VRSLTSVGAQQAVPLLLFLWRWEIASGTLPCYSWIVPKQWSKAPTGIGVFLFPVLLFLTFPVRKSIAVRNDIIIRPKNL